MASTGHPGARKGEPAAGAEDHGPVLAGGDQAADVALGDGLAGHPGGRRRGRRAVGVWPAEQGELDPLAGVELAQPGMPVAGDVTGDEEDRLHRSALS